MIATLVVVVLVHVLIYLATETPFSTDVWPLIEISQRLLNNPDLKIWIDSAFDGYNNRWPGTMLAAVVLNRVLKLDLYTLYGLYMVLVLNTAIALLVYAICRKCEKPVLSMALLLALPSFVIFTSSTLKEVYSYPIMLATYLLILNSKNIYKHIALLPLLAFSQVLCHHLSTAMSLLIALGTLIAISLDKLLGYDTPKDIAKNVALYLLIGVPIAVAYYIIYGGYGLRIAIGFSDATTLAMYLFVAYITPIIAPPKRDWGLALGSLIVGIGLVIFVAITQLHLVAGLELKLSNLYLYAVGALLPILIPRKQNKVSYVNQSLLLTIVAIMGFIIFSKPMLTNILHRIANYFAFYHSIASYRVDNKAARVVSISTTVAVATISMLILSTLLLGLDNVCFYWLYRQEDLELSAFLIKYLNPSTKVLGDDKLGYLESMKLEVDISSLLRFASLGLGALNPNSLLVVSIDNVRRGFAIALNIYRLPASLHVLESTLSRVYSSPNNAMYWC